ncbi:NfeD family protein [Chloroflexota bacterium]
MIRIGDYEIAIWLIVVLAIGVVVFIIFVINRGRKAHRLQVAAGKEELIGRAAQVKVALDPRGTVFIEGEQWSAISEAGRVEPEEEVIITKVDGLKLYVTKKE